MPAPAPQTVIRKQLTVSEWTPDNEALVNLNGQPIGRLVRTPGWIWATVLDTSWGGGRTISNALRAIAMGYVQLTQTPR